MELLEAAAELEEGGVEVEAGQSLRESVRMDELAEDGDDEEEEGEKDESGEAMRTAAEQEEAPKPKRSSSAAAINEYIRLKSAQKMQSAGSGTQQEDAAEVSARMAELKSQVMFSVLMEGTPNTLGGIGEFIQQSSAQGTPADIHEYIRQKSLQQGLGLQPIAAYAKSQPEGKEAGGPIVATWWQEPLECVLQGFRQAVCLPANK